LECNACRDATDPTVKTDSQDCQRVNLFERYVMISHEESGIDFSS